MTKQSESFDSIREFYDNEYYADLAQHQTLPWHCRSIARRLGDMRGREVLDVACGAGQWLGHLHGEGAAIAGVDLSARAIDACRKRFPEGEFHCGPAESLPFEDSRFDLVTCMGSLEHFLDKPAALSEMKRVAKPDAQFLILVPNAGFLTRRLGLYGGTQQVKVKEDVYELAQWETRFASAGLRVTKRWRDLHPVSLSWIRHGKPLTWPVRALQALALTLWPVRWQYQVYFRCQADHE